MARASLCSCQLTLTATSHSLEVRRQISMAFVNEVVEFFAPPLPSVFAAKGPRDAPPPAAAEPRLFGGTPVRVSSPRVVDARVSLHVSSGSAGHVDLGAPRSLAGITSTAATDATSDVAAMWDAACTGAFPGPAQLLRARPVSHHSAGAAAAVPQPPAQHRGQPGGVGDAGDTGDSSARGVSTGDLSAMKQRAATILTFKYVRIGAITVELSFKGV